MTEERMALLELIEKGADADLVRELLAYAGERLMAVEVDQLTGAAAGARSPERVNYRNGIGNAAGRPASGGSSLPSLSSERAHTFLLSLSRAARLRRL